MVAIGRASLFEVDSAPGELPARLLEQHGQHCALSRPQQPILVVLEAKRLWRLQYPVDFLHQFGANTVATVASGCKQLPQVEESLLYLLQHTVTRASRGNCCCKETVANTRSMREQPVLSAVGCWLPFVASIPF